MKSSPIRVFRELSEGPDLGGGPVFPAWDYYIAWMWPWVKRSKAKIPSPSEHPNTTTKIGSKMGGEFNSAPLVLTHSHVSTRCATVDGRYPFRTT